MNEEKKSDPRLKIGEWVKRLFAIVFGLGFAWILLELLIRVAYPVFPYTIQAALREVQKTPFTEERILPQQIWQFDFSYQFISRAGVNNELQFPDPRVGFYVTTKNWLDPESHVGFRVPSADWEPRWPVDAVIVGDSFSFCYTEYNACWVQRLEDNHGMSVVNLGQVATGSMSHLNLLGTFGLPYQPRVIIWQWYGNDFNDDYGMAVMNGDIPPVEESAQQTEQTSIQLPDTAFTRWLERNSAVYWILLTAISSEKDLYKYERYIDSYQAGDSDFHFTFGRPYILKAFDMENPKNQIGLTLTQAAILKARDLLAENGISLILLLVPVKEEVYRHWTQEVMGVVQVDALSQGRRQMLEFCNAEGLLCLDTTSILTQSVEQEKHVYWPDDTHLNDLGNKLLADELWDFLSEERLLEK